MNCTISSSRAKTGGLSVYIRELRAPFLSASILPMIAGATLAYRRFGKISFAVFSLSLLCAALIHLGSNTLNDYFDYLSGSDSAKVLKTPFSGGSGMLSGREISPQKVMALSISLLVSGFIAGVAAILLSNADLIILLLLGLAGIFVGYAYTAPPLKLSYRGMGEALVFLAFGPLPVVVSYYINSGVFSMASLVASIPFGLMTVAILWINQFPDYLTDRQAGKCNLLVRLGLKRGCYGYYLLIALTSLSLLLGVYLGALPPGGLFGLLFLFPLIPACLLLHKNFGEPQKLVPAMGLTIVAHTLMSILIIVGSYT